MKDSADKNFNTKRIWELDAFRGLFILAVVFIHVMFDLDMFGFIDLSTWPSWYHFIQEYGGILFILISGICITLGTKHIKRGVIVLSAALIVTVVTYLLGDPSNYIFFGILHLMAFCMLTYPLYRRLPTPLLFILGAVIIGVGFYFETINVETEYLYWLGLTSPYFTAGDFFPVFPNLGFYMIGVVLGRTLYKDKKSLMPNFPYDNFIIKAFSWLGRNSLFVYLGHQPIAYGACALADYFINL